MVHFPASFLVIDFNELLRPSPFIDHRQHRSTQRFGTAQVLMRAVALTACVISPMRDE